MKIKVAATSDIHGRIPVIEEDTDLFLFAGDLTPVSFSGLGNEKLESLDFYTNQFLPFLSQLKNRGTKVAWVAGNHDFHIESIVGSDIRLPSNYLQDSFVEHFGLKIYGFPYCPKLSGWAFYKTDEEFKELSLNLPKADIYLMHSPPNTVLDSVMLRHVGAPYVKNAILEHSPKQVIFGHIHECHGVYKINDTIFRNVSYVDEKYYPVNKIQYFEMEV